MKKYIQFSAGQAVFIVMCLVAGGFLDFYFGARFGPEIFWDISLDQPDKPSLLPDEVYSAEIEKMLAEEGEMAVTFHKELEKIEPPAKPEVALVKKKAPNKADAPVETIAVKKEDVLEKPADKPALPVNYGRYTLKVGSFSSLREAKELEQKFRNAGFSVYVQTVNIPNKGGWYRVHIGHYTTSTEAARNKAMIEKRYGIMPVIVML